jgi:nucleotide-binding universal stress UspA family protein
MDEASNRHYAIAIQDFREARQQAALERIAARLTGRSAELLAFDDVRRMLKAQGQESRGLQEIPLDAIVGSVGRYVDFTRSFLPRTAADQERWARVKTALTDLGKFTPIDVYQIGDVYFVQDGNHRVSIARKLGASTIQAYVTRVHTRVPLSPSVQPDEIILLSEYADFLEHTSLDQLRPDSNLQVTVPARYPLLCQQIDYHHLWLEQQRGEQMPYSEAVTDWYDNVYEPAVEAIRAQDILMEFPGRTETDLFIWLAQHREELQRELRWEVTTEDAAAKLAEQHSRRPRRVLTRIGDRIREALTPKELEGEPGTGQWRRTRLSARRSDRLFLDVLVPISGEPRGWQALDQAIEIARREGGRLLGLHVVSSPTKLDTVQSQVAQSEFSRRCELAEVRGELVVEVGQVAPIICARAWWADLVVMSLAHPPGSQPVERLRSGFHTVLRQCPRPILAVPDRASPLDRALLAYDGSPKAREALYVATYLAGCWGIELAVITVPTEHTPAAMLRGAREYLEARGITARYLEGSTPIAKAVLTSAEAHDSNLIIMGGYGYGLVREMVLGSTVDEVLRTFRSPVLICR